tara:strand:+ start:10722 stop:11858 length:1137 start_codon:yes stop_codon:yes gene_type:complete
MSIEEQSCISVITLLRGEQEFIPLIKANFQEFNYPKDKLELVIIDDGKESLMEHFIDDERYLYLHLNDKEINEFIGKIDFPNDKEGILKNYQTRIKRLPNGFKRDYGVGMSSNGYFFHMDYDTSYHKDAINRKLKFLKDKKVNCVYNSNILCHDFHSKDYSKLYKSENPYHIYEATLFHTKQYWQNGGFKWSDISNEGRFFSDNHGQQRKMDNYYDSVKLLNIRNVQEYKPIALDLQKSEFTYEIKKDVIDQIKIDINPIKDSVEELFSDISVIQVLGIHSDFIQSLEENTKYNCHNIKEKFKQTKLSKEIKQFNSEFNVLLFGSKQPAWSIFEEIKFDCILLETQKNMEQMHSIIQGCKKYKYIYLNGIYINKQLLV